MRLTRSMRPDLGDIYDTHAPAVFAYLLNATRNYADASDILQEVFMKVAAQPQLLEGVARPRSWLIRSAHFLAMDGHRKRKRESLATTEASAEVELFMREDDADGEAFNAALTDALVHVPAEQRAVVHLKIWEEMTFSEIAEALGISANTAASRYRYALEKLETLLRPLHDQSYE